MLRSILTLTLFLSIEILGLIFTPFAASAAPQCDERANVISVLSEKYKEHQSAVGVTMNGALLEIWESEGGETWSILVTTPGGLSCLVAAGESWQQVTVLPGTGL